MDIQDKVVIITGASEGIGLATTRLFAEAGAADQNPIVLKLWPRRFLMRHAMSRTTNTWIS